MNHPPPTPRYHVPRRPNLTRRYALVLGAVAVLAGEAYATSRVSAARYAQDAAAMQLAASQRTLGRQLGQAALGAVSAAPGPERDAWLDQLRATTDRWEAAHREPYADARGTIAERSPAVASAHRRMLRRAHTLDCAAEAGAPDSTLRAPLTALLADERRYADGMDRIVGAMQAASAARVRAHHRADLVMLVGTLLLFTVVGVAVLRPALAARAEELRRRSDELSRARAELEEQAAAVRAREEQLQLYVRHTPLAVAMCDRELRYLAVSERWRADAAAANSMLSGETHLALAPQAPRHWQQVVQRCLAGAAERCDEEAVVRPDGTLGWMRWAVHPWHTADGGVGGLIVFYEGITRRKHAEVALRDSEERLRGALHSAEAASRAKSDFMARMSHELRTPLNSIIGFANVLRKNKHGTLRPADVNYLERVYANGTHLLGIINDILDLSKVEAGKVEVSAAPVDLDALVRETLAELAGQPHPGVVLRAEVPVGATVETDAAKLKQVLINLVGNALKFTERGSVTVRVEADAAGHARALVVHDTGIGIPEDRRQAIFEAFEQAEASTARRYGGTGLGLAITRSLCTLLGARLSLESAVGVGSTFRVAFAAHPARPHPAGAGA